LPKQQEICLVTAGGQNYDIWTTVEVSRNIDDKFIDHALLVVSEVTSGAKALADLKLKPGDHATVTLAGQKVLDGQVYLRQAAYRAREHAVQIGICSFAQNVIASTVDVNPGQYINQTLQQIVSACFGKVGIGFSIDGSPPGADKVFPRVSEHIGESRYDFAERLCRMRNIHMVDGGNSNIIGFRGPAKSGSLDSSGRLIVQPSKGSETNTGLMLQEGVNILQARLLLSNNDFASEQAVNGDDTGNDAGDANRSSEATASLTPPNNRNIKLRSEMPGDDADMKMRVNHEADWSYFTTVDGLINVAGWLTGNGDLWFNHLRELVVLNSPMLLPNDSMKFLIKGIVHKQSSEEGSTTDVLIANELSKGQEEASK
jgi:prophage tail gpP-like protein